jgi:hypothetical protein
MLKTILSQFYGKEFGLTTGQIGLQYIAPLVAPSGRKSAVTDPIDLSRGAHDVLAVIFSPSYGSP